MFITLTIPPLQWYVFCEKFLKLRIEVFENELKKNFNTMFMINTYTIQGVEKLIEGNKKISIEKPAFKHVPGIKKLIDYYAKKQIVLPRSIADIYEKIRIFWVALDNEEVIGCVGLQFYWNELAEVKSLAVDERYHGQGIGVLLVNQCIQEAKEFGVKKLFALTYIPGFFEKNGFHKVEKDELPQKIWTECINCQHFPNCEEDAVVREL